MPDHSIGNTSGASQRRTSHARDLRFAGAVSAGLVSAILVGGALLAPVADWNGITSSPPSDKGQTITLATPRTAQGNVADGSSTSDLGTAASRGLGRLGLGAGTPGDLG